MISTNAITPNPAPVRGKNTRSPNNRPTTGDNVVDPSTENRPITRTKDPTSLIFGYSEPSRLVPRPFIYLRDPRFNNGQIPSPQSGNSLFLCVALLENLPNCRPLTPGPFISSLRPQNENYLRPIYCLFQFVTPGPVGLVLEGFCTLKG